MEHASVLATCVVGLIIVGIQVAVWPLLRPLSTHRWQPAFRLANGGLSTQLPPRQQTLDYDAAGNIAVLQLLQQAQEAVQDGTINSNLSHALQLHDDSMPPLGAVEGEEAQRGPQHLHCQPHAEALRLVAATAFTADVSPDTPGTADSPTRAYAAADTLRREVAGKWAAALTPLAQPVATSKLKSTDTAGDASAFAGRCRSIHIPPLKSLQQKVCCQARRCADRHIIHDRWSS